MTIYRNFVHLNGEVIRQGEVIDDGQETVTFEGGLMMTDRWAELRRDSKAAAERMAEVCGFCRCRIYAPCQSSDSARVCRKRKD